MEKLYRFYWNCRRMGHLEGLFICEEERVKRAIGKYIYFGEVLGKHSEVDMDLEEKDIEEITDDQDVIEKFLKLFHDGNIAGYNPVHIYEEHLRYSAPEELEGEELALWETLKGSGNKWEREQLAKWRSSNDTQ